MSGEDPLALISRVLGDEQSANRGRTGVACYVAVGDSFTAGTGCGPGEAWPELLAEALRASNGEVAYRNLAFDGATSADVIEQLGTALQLEPDLITAVCGANDVLRSTRPDVDGYARRMARILRRLQAAVPEARIVTATAPEGWNFLPLGRRTRERVERGIRAMNAQTREIAAAHGVPCLEVAGHPGLVEPENFSDDGLHPSALGHAHAASAFAATLREHFDIDCADPKGGTR